MSSMVKKGLGSGVNALFGNQPILTPKVEGEQVLQLSLDSVAPNAEQPRRVFDEGKLRELAASVKEQGVLQPILVRPVAGSHNKYEIVAGERRWRAAKMAGLKDIPAIVKSLNDDVTLEVALIENIQRQDLNSLEEAATYRRLLDEHGYTQASLATRLGKSRVYVANTLRLLALPESIRSMITVGRLSAGHGKALLMLESEADRLALAEKIQTEGLSVRQAEEMAKNPDLIYAVAPEPAASDKGDKAEKPAAAVKDAPSQSRPSTEELLLQDISDKLCARLQTKVKLQKTTKGGRIMLEYYSNDELSRLLEILLPDTSF